MGTLATKVFWDGAYGVIPTRHTLLPHRGCHATMTAEEATTTQPMPIRTLSTLPSICEWLGPETAFTVLGCWEKFLFCCVYMGGWENKYANPPGQHPVLHLLSHPGTSPFHLSFQLQATRMKQKSLLWAGINELGIPCILRWTGLQWSDHVPCYDQSWTESWIDSPFCCVLWAVAESLCSSEPIVQCFSCMLLSLSMTVYHQCRKWNGDSSRN